MAVPFILGRTHLIIRPQTAQLTRDTETFGKMDPQVVINIGGMTYRGTVAEGQGKTPQWNDSLSHMVQGTEKELTLTVLEVDSVSKSDLVGECKINLGEVIQRGTTSNWYEIFFDGRSAGKVMVFLQIVNQ